MDISVIVPVYNSEGTIVECLESIIQNVIGRKYKWELIIVNDGSTDRSSEIVAKYIRESEYNENITFIEQSNSGPSAARNVGLRAAKGRYIAFNDSDDRWMSDKIDFQLEFLERNPDVDMIGCLYGDDNVRRRSMRRIHRVNVISIRDQVMKNYFAPPTVVIRRSILGLSGLFKEDLRYAEEGFLFNNIAYHGKAVFINRRVAECIVKKSRWGDTGLSGNIGMMERGELSNIRHAYTMKHISAGLYILALVYSVLKYIRRYVIARTNIHASKE